MNIYIGGNNVGKIQIENDSCDEIYLGEAKIRPTNTDYQPGPNTIVYYNFDNNLNDRSGNNRNLAISAGSISYGSTQGGGKYAYFNRNTRTNTFSYNMNFSNPYTLLMYVKFNSWNNSSNNAIVEIAGGKEYIRIGNRNSGCMFLFGMSNATTVITDNNWHLLAYTRQGGTANVYVDGVLKQTGVPYATTSGSYTNTFRLNNCHNTNSNSYSNDVYIGKLIRETGMRDVEKITEYYNLTTKLFV